MIENLMKPNLLKKSSLFVCLSVSVESTLSIPACLPGKLPGDLPGKLPGDLPGMLPGDLPGKLPGDSLGMLPGEGRGVVMQVLCSILNLATMA
jgi:hypothetical protein